MKLVVRRNHPGPMAIKPPTQSIAAVFSLILLTRRFTPPKVTKANRKTATATSESVYGVGLVPNQLLP